MWRKKSDPSSKRRVNVPLFRIQAGFCKAPEGFLSCYLSEPPFTFTFTKHRQNWKFLTQCFYLKKRKVDEQIDKLRETPTFSRQKFAESKIGRWILHLWFCAPPPSYPNFWKSCKSCSKCKLKYIFWFAGFEWTQRQNTAHFTPLTTLSHHSLQSPLTILFVYIWKLASSLVLLAYNWSLLVIPKLIFPRSLGLGIALPELSFSLFISQTKTEFRQALI